MTPSALGKRKDRKEERGRSKHKREERVARRSRAQKHKNLGKDSTLLPPTLLTTQVALTDNGLESEGS
mgnify:CR=1 FL=1|eukprot:scaffold25245_cov31-Tisochrysis_lutea.AAC.1